MVKNPSASAGDTAPSLGQEDPLEEAMAAHSTILAWRIPWTEEPGRLQSSGLQRVRHDLATKQQIPYTRHSSKEHEGSGRITKADTSQSLL